MAEYKLSYTAEQIDEKLGKIDELEIVGEAVEKLIEDGGIGYVDGDVTTIFDQTITPDEYGDSFVEYVINLENEKTYVVNIDGTEYESKCFVFEDEVQILCIGNQVFFGAEDNGQPFIIVSDPSEGVSMFKLFASDLSTPLAGDHHVIIKSSGKIHKIDPKFLPDGVDKIDVLATVESVNAALSEAKAYSDGKGGYVETKVFTNDGNNDDKESFIVFGYSFVRIGDVIDPYTITELTVLEGGETGVIKDELTITEIDSGVTTVGIFGSDVIQILQENNARGVSAGTYVYSASNSRITHIVTETVHTIDPKYLPDECITKIIDLTKFTANNGSTYSDILMGLCFESLSNGGDMRVTTAVDNDLELREQASTNRQIVTRINVGDNYIDYPTIKAFDSEGIVWQLSFTGVQKHENIYFDLQAVIQFLSLVNGDAQIMVKATPITA